MRKKLLAHILDRPIAFHRIFVDLPAGDKRLGVLGALMLSQALYWTARTEDPEGWFWKTAEEWQQETGMTRREQETARKRLRATGFWHEERRGLPAKLYFRVNLEALARALEKAASEKQDCTNAPNKDAQNGQTGLDESGNLLTKTTTKTTSEINPDTDADASVQAQEAPAQTPSRKKSRKKKQAPIPQEAHGKVIRALAYACGFVKNPDEFPRLPQSRLGRLRKEAAEAIRAEAGPDADREALAQAAERMRKWLIEVPKVWPFPNPPTPTQAVDMAWRVKNGTARNGNGRKDRRDSPLHRGFTGEGVKHEYRVYIPEHLRKEVSDEDDF